MKNILILLFFSMILLSSVYAVEPTQQYNLILRNPFYVASMSANAVANSTITVNPPDRISSVVTAIFHLQVYMGSTTTNISITVNGQKCNTGDYVVTGTFGQAGEANFYYDCSNIINKAGVYNLSVRTSAALGPSSGWLEVTYMNSPKGSIDFHGTEYIPGDSGRMFLQFLDANKMPINNSACTLSLWYPNNTKFVNNSAMTYLDEGIYYYNFLVPTTPGVYPASAKCYVPYQFAGTTIANKVTENWESNTWTGGTGWAGTNATTTWDYYAASIYTNATAGTGGCYGGNYCAGIVGAAGSTSYLERGLHTDPNTQQVTICYAVKQSGFGSGDRVDIDIFDGVWHIIDSYTNALTANVWVPHCHNISVSEGYNLDQNSLLFGVYPWNLVSPSKTFYIDNITMAYTYLNTTISNVSAYQLLMGSGEVHISNMYAQLNSSSLTAQQVWNYTNRTLTSIEINYTAISDTVWNATNRTLTYYPPASVDTAAVALAVWNYTTRNLTYYQNFTVPQVDLTNYSRISNLTAFDVWEYINRNLTYYPNMTVITQNVTVQNVSVITQNVTVQNVTVVVQNVSVITQNVTVQNVSVITQNVTVQNVTVNESSIANAVWTNTERNLTYYQNFTVPQQDLTNYSRISNLTAQEVWEYNNRNLTYYPNLTVNTQVVNVDNVTVVVQNVSVITQNVTVQNVSVITQNVTVQNVTVVVQNVSVNETSIANTVWTNPERNLTYYQNFTVPQQDLTNYSRISNLTAQEVWEYNNRNLTYYPNMTVNTQNVTVQNVTVVVQNVSVITQNVTVQNVTVVTQNVSVNNVTVVVQNVSVNESSIANTVWTNTDRNLTYYPPQVDMTNYTRIDDTIYAVNASLYQKIIDESDLILTTMINLWNQTNINISQIPSEVWSYAIRNLTYYPPQVDLTNYSRISNLTALDVWEYVNRNLTYYPNMTVNTQVVNVDNVTVVTQNVTVQNVTVVTQNVSVNNVTVIIQNTTVDYDIISGSVWNYTNRNLTYYQNFTVPQQDLTNYSLIIEGVWAYNIRNLTYYPAQQDLTNYSLINEGVWTYNNRNLTYYEVNNITPSEIWTYSTRNLTYYPTQQDLTNYTLITENVWNYNNRTLTYYEVNNITSSEIWGYINRTLTYYEVNNITAADVWVYTNRTLTYYPTATDNTNYTKIVDEVWNGTARYIHGTIYS